MTHTTFISKLARWASMAAHRSSRHLPGQEKTLFPNGHFYSPVASRADLAARRDSIWRNRDGCAGVDFREEAQLKLLHTLARHASGIRFPTEADGAEERYFYSNDQFPALDAEFLYAALCEWRPRKMIEIGSGYSSLVTAEVNRSVLHDALDFTCVEPYPRQYLIDGVRGITRLKQCKVQDVPADYFAQLGEGDILFIDSSHVAKVGSDVNYLMFDVIPALAPGVYVHIHDIFLPDEYPQKWMIDEGRNWNEQYVTQAFLMFNNEWEVVWAANFMATRHTEEVSRVFPCFPKLGGGGSLWIRRKQA
jgi:hypothetical protein